MPLRDAALLSLFCLLLALPTACKSDPPAQVEATPQTTSSAATPEGEANAKAPAKEAPAADAPSAIKTRSGAIAVTPLEHGSLRLSWEGQHIYVDPTTSALDTRGQHPEADLVLVTHIHGDHLDPEAIARVRAEGAPVVAPKSVADKAGEALPDPTVLANGESRVLLGGKVKVLAVPMYNLERKRDNGEPFHPEGRGNGYVLEVDGARVYLSGDTECTPEMKALKDIDAAFVCMNLPYTMPVEEAGACIEAFEPKVAYPYHHRGQDVTKLEGLVGDAVEVRLLDWYPKGG